ncbi:ABC transporter permease [Gymnodinialimonas ceratoperidinii]|uniref:ABC transporter permease n=1 Tax=Gymnodinialimonas ceratoperidinii TaxID=2856823 RepID=A0A8F6TV54_9RHOB|nr:ABC transporter permease [Gymnodinialimonas ceratoperidinii]
MARGLTNDAKQGLIIVSPALIYALLLLAVPLLTIILFSFWTQNFLTIDRTLTLENYREALTDPLYRALMLRSLRISASVTAVTVVLAFPIAYFISFKVRPERKALWLFLITIPFWTSYLIRIFLWRVILAYDGPVNGTLMGLGIIDQPLSFILYNANAVIITLAHAFAPFAILPIFVSLEKIDRSLLEAARDLGEATVMTFMRVTLPLAMPGVLAAVLIVFIPTVGDYVTPRLVGGSGGTMIANMIYVQIFDLSNRPMGATLAVFAMASVTLTLAWGIMRVRFWVHLSDRLGGGLTGTGAAALAAVIDIGLLWWLLTKGHDVFGPAGSLGLMAAIMGGGAIAIAVFVPKGRWGI